ncbi:membrane protein insertase YidC [Aurantibacter aestuarii]|uniref:Membrane protein insertase YidC n=1 Tax=Aurantibacter aestuarii TaxID=1266046 RepID=A0A2T1N9V8_9FLAO|nr:membrane protein insertase YidC [Aurantibacter aestuarii]PSG88613.1 membrane protein insertase YidC [Aurantibacter aestuarii]
MEEKKIDTKSIIGFVLIFGILLFMMWQNQPTPEELAEKEKQEQVAKQKEAAKQELTSVKEAEQISEQLPENDSLKTLALQNKLGAFAYGANAKEELITVENEVLSLKFNTKGAYLAEVKLKKHTNFNDGNIFLVKDNNSSFNLNFGTTDNRILNTKDVNFAPKVFKNGENTIVSFKLNVSDSKFLEYKYVLKPNDYMLDFSINSIGLDQVINSSKEVDLEWTLKTISHDQSVSYENRYTRLTYSYDDGEIDKLSATGEDEEIEQDVKWLSFRQHFFSSILVADQPFNKMTLASRDLVKNEEIDTLFTKQYAAKSVLDLKSNNLASNFQLYFGPTDSKILSQYENDLEESIPYGWGIFGWINKFLFIPLFDLLSGFLPYGIAIIVMTVLIKLAMSFVQYKQYLSQMKMKILKPELDAIREKYKNNKLKAQQETMALQSKAGASPLAGCLPALIQMPVFYALFTFFPVAFALRQKKFLWADDLSSYDVVAELPFNIPLYGDHVSLFPILAAIAIFFYMKLTTGQQQMQAPQQEGMPDMTKIMKYMIYFAPIMMLIFFNNYASGLSLYYFISNLISIGILLVIKNLILDEDKILAKIEVNKSKPKKENRFQKKMKEMMEEAEKQKNLQNQKKK